MGNSLAWVPGPEAEPPDVGLIASLGPAGGRYLDPSDDFSLPGLPPLERTETQPPDEDPTFGGLLPAPPQEWERGFKYRPDAVCDNGGVTDPCATDMEPPSSQPANVEMMPFIVWTGDRCSTFGWRGNDYAGRVTRALLAVESKRIAREFWTGDQATASGWPNPYLAAATSDTLTQGPASPGDALACLEQGIATAGNGQRGAIHCSRQLATKWAELGSTFRSAGGLILTYMGTLIIADAGYDGSGPLGQDPTDGSQWAYGTLVPQVRRGTIHYTPSSFAEATDRSVNTITWLAWRAAAATFPACVHVAAEINVPLCVTGGAS